MLEDEIQKRFLHGRHDDFRVIGAHDTVLDFADLFSIALGNDNVQEFAT